MAVLLCTPAGRARSARARRRGSAQAARGPRPRCAGGRDGGGKGDGEDGLGEGRGTPRRSELRKFEVMLQSPPHETSLGVHR